MKPNSFQAIAPYYDFLSKLVFGKNILRAQKVFLDRLPKHANILFVGGGSGEIMSDLLYQAQPKRITYIEASSAMLARAKKGYQKISHHIKSDTHVEFICGTEAQIPSGTLYDAVLTFFVLDVYNSNEAKLMVTKLSYSLKDKGEWLFADFTKEGKGISRLWKIVMLMLMYKFFSLSSGLKNQSLPDFTEVFQSIGYMPFQERFFYHRFIRSALYRKVVV